MNSGLGGLPQPYPVARANWNTGAGEPRSGLGGLSQYAPPLTILSTADVSNPPTSAELTSAFGEATNGFRAVVDDGGAGTNIYLVERLGDVWLYAALTKAV